MPLGRLSLVSLCPGIVGRLTDWLLFVCATFISRPGIRRIELILFYIQARSGIINGQEVRD